ncbi:hypothetical protein EK21DRAFT_110887 [Setomelanomma holmii]|uniref:RING-type domain-containing protein n=1 Tax=Setomelanomma holmii TaxID=210430 RepID=A0A9P4LNR3_9PLEO|nr:hypothetical protein EK21DRAFT_110887 [Setomelanomma holmii]
MSLHERVANRFLSYLMDEPPAPCVICSVHFDDDHIPVAMPFCRHRFGRECIRRWIVDERATTCPTCRTQLFDPTPTKQYPEGTFTVSPNPALRPPSQPNVTYGQTLLPEPKHLILQLPDGPYQPTRDQVLKLKQMLAEIGQSWFSFGPLDWQMFITRNRPSIDLLKSRWWPYVHNTMAAPPSPAQTLQQATNMTKPNNSVARTDTGHEHTPTDNQNSIFDRPRFLGIKDRLELMDYLTIPHGGIDPLPEGGVCGEWPYQYPASLHPKKGQFNDEGMRQFARKVISERLRRLQNESEEYNLDSLLRS